MSIIKTEHLTHIYSQGTPYERAALQDFNIEIEEGEFAGIPAPASPPSSST